nr:ATP-binding protein [bacterium]
MEGKINMRLLLIGLISMVLTAGMSLFVFHHVFDGQIKKDMAISANLLAQAYPSLESPKGLDAFQDNGLRITLISADGEVLYESLADSSSMDNHLARPEIADALAHGQGEAVRTSGTLGYNTYYYALRLDDGNVLRISMQTATLYAAWDNIVPVIILIGFAVLLLSVLVSVLLTKQLVRPIEAMAEHLDDIDTNIPYKELAPFALAIKQQQNKKEENERMRQEFTANVSHELKTPLTSISGYAEMIENGMARDEDIKDFAGKIHNEAGRLITLIGDIIKLSELDEPGEREFGPVDLYELALGNMELLSFNADKENIALSLDGQKAMVWGDSGMLSELIYNLMDNAIRYNVTGGQVHVEVKPLEKSVMLTVSDTGIGIPPEHQDRIFERFYRVDKSRSKETGGTGLGLAIVKHIAIQHHAKITVKSQQGKGTRIVVEFPGEGAARQA